ncbi:MAG: chemotaxis protein CheD [Lentisphaerae bacterium GWF2_52_8]|nr:MAG: chemotaxis protein CheD [Lentisphaerae bacterium GWF2_52_8]
MSTIMLGIGDYGASSTPGDIVKTLALGSCVGIILLDPRYKMVGMVHVALPDSSINQKKRDEKPGYFADSALPALLARMKQLGSDGNIKEMYVKLAGGAHVLDASSTFDVGKRNILAVKKALWQYGTGATAEDVGGQISRTIAVFVDAGHTELSSPGRENWSI